MSWRDFTPDFIEDAGEDVVEGIGDGVEWLGDKTADLAEDVGWDDGADWVREKSRSLANSMGAEVAELELDQTEDPKKIIYGSVSKIRSNAKHLTDFRTNFDKVGTGIKGLSADSIKGVTADAYAEHVAKQPPKWFKAADAFEKAEGALTRFAETVEWAQNQARDAIEEYKKAKKASQDARTAYNAKVDEYNDAVKAKKDDLPPRPSGFTDPGEAGIKAAYDKVISAREQRNEAAETAKTALTAARDAAPPKPSYAQQVGDGFEGIAIDANHLVGGVIKGTAGIVNFARSVNPLDPYNLTHPAEYLTNLNNTVTGLAVAANDPLGTAKNMIDAFQKDPAEGLGKLIPEILGTKGLGMAKKAATVGKYADNGKPSPPRQQVDSDGPNTTCRTPKDKVCVDDPVDVATGRMVLPQTDLVLPGALPLVLNRTFESSYRAGRWFGPSWSGTLDQRLEIDAEGVILVGEDGGLLTYPHPAPGLPALPTHGRRWPLARTPEGDYTVTDPESGRTWRYGAEGTLLQLDDRNGNWIAYEYDIEGAPTGISHSGGYRVRITSAHGRITSLSLAEGTRILDFGYTEGRLTEVVNSSGKPLRFDYDDQARITSWTDTNGRRFDYSYDDRHRCIAQSGTNGHLNMRYAYEEGLTLATNALGHTRRYTVNERAQVLSETDATGAAVHTERDRYNRVLSHTDQLGHVTRLTYDEAGRVTAIEGPDGRTSSAEYNALGRPVRVVGADGSVVRQTYDERGNLTAMTGPSGVTTRFGYDERGNLASVTDGLGHTTTVRCDPAGLPVEQTDPLGGVTRWTRDAFGRPVAVTDPLGHTTRMAWSVEGRLVERVAADGTKESWTYDGEGNCVLFTDAAGGTTVSEYGDFDLLAARTGPDGVRYAFAHDAELRLTGVTNPQGLAWTYSHDPAGRVISETDFDGRTTGYTYDPAGRLTECTTPSGARMCYERDELGRLVREDVNGKVRHYEYDVAGQLGRVSDSEGEVLRLWDRAGRLASETVNGRTLSFTYDRLGRRTSRTTPTGSVAAWTHDEAGQQVRMDTSGRTVTFERDAVGRVLSRTLGDGTSVSHTYDELGRRTGQALVGRDGRTLRRRGYAYRADGALTAIDDSATGQRRFSLDTAGRVTAVDASGWSERYGYDEAGNQTTARWPQTHPGAEAVGERVYEGTRVRRAGSVRYEYDAAGRVILRQKVRLSRKADTWRYAWDAEDRLVGVVTPDGTEWRYRYDPLGRRTAKQRLTDTGEVAEEVLFTWDGPVLCEQTNVSDELPHPVTLTWTHQGMHPVTQTERITAESPQSEVDTRFFSIVTDLVGTPTELVDEEGEVAWHTRATVWGTTTWNRDATAYTPLRFPGQYYDPESGLHHNVFRTYDPETARYLSPDPLGLAPAPNPVAYVHNPHTWYDALGLTPCGIDLSQATPHQGRFPKTANPDEILVRRKEDGTVTAYAVYGPDGLPLKRVDVDPDSAPHGGVPAPHVLETHRNVNPKTGQEFLTWDKMPRPARPDELPR
ncbi:putative T7SS-secreted protein [Streptomyces sp. NPDC002054]|uniref:putative T7SS-secreted protein n=1 Tax=Streptomyces sp. NPDC002054 TaxID=3154663 RepID=UPI00332291BE